MYNASIIDAHYGDVKHGTSTPVRSVERGRESYKLMLDFKGKLHSISCHRRFAVPHYWLQFSNVAREGETETQDILDRWKSGMAREPVRKCVMTFEPIRDAIASFASAHLSVLSNEIEKREKRLEYYRD
ncbi:MAG: hypothetical protein ACI32C_04360 [Candidatus Enteromonas sp.]